MDDCYNLKWDRRYRSSCKESARKLLQIYHGFGAYMVETSVALAALLIAALVVGLSRHCVCQMDHLKVTIFSTMCLTLISGILDLVAIGACGNGQIVVNSLSKKLRYGSPLLSPFSLWLTGVGGILSVVAFFAILCGIRMCQAEPNDLPSYEMMEDVPVGPRTQSAPANGPTSLVGQPTTVHANTGGYDGSSGHPVPVYLNFIR